MTKQSLLVFDVAEQTFQENAELSSADGPALSGADTWSVRHRRLRGGLSEGVDLIELDNGALSVTIVPTRGMGIWKGSYRDIPLGWQSPVRQVVNPAFVELADRGGLGWLAGFNEWLCRCGLSFNGPPGEDVITDDSGNEIARSPVTLHGRIANTPAHRVEIEADPAGDGLLSVTGVVDETAFFGPSLRLTTRMETAAGSNWLQISDTITNLGGQPAEMELLYHTNIGRPFLEPAAQVIAPALEVIPRDPQAAAGARHWNTYGEPAPGFPEEGFFLKLAGSSANETEILLRNAKGDLGLSMKFSLDQLPWFTVWKNTVAEADGYVTGLEPSTNLPNFKTYERQQGRVITLQPGQSYQTQLEIAVHSSADEVQQVTDRITRLQNGQAAKVHPAAQPGISPAGDAQ